MLARRIIACLDVRDGQVVKGVNFQRSARRRRPRRAGGALQRRGHRRARRPRHLRDARRASGPEPHHRRDRGAAVHSACGRRRHPIAGRREGRAGRGRRQSQHQQRGAAATCTDHDTRGDVRQPGGGRGDRRAPRGASGTYDVLSRSGTHLESTDAVAWAREAADRGAGEILLTSIDRDGTRAGFDCDLTAAVSAAVPIPVIASGGAGTLEHFAEVFTDGRADAALAASIFHYADTSVRDLKRALAAQGIPVRLVS